MINVYDTSGQLVQTTKGMIQNRNLLSTIKTSDWRKGIYFAKIKIGEIIVTRKYVKQ